MEGRVQACRLLGAVLISLIVSAAVSSSAAKVHHRPKTALHERLCSLHNNIIVTKRQLTECNFQSVVIVVSPEHAWQQQANGVNSSTGRIDTARSPFPVIICTPINHTDDGTLFYRGLPNDAYAPPCIRPEHGREEVAYAAFILQNYDRLPEHMYFIHGHESSWHQDKPMNSILSEFVNRTMPSSLYVSLNMRLNQDWRKIRCYAPWGCHSSRMQRALEQLYAAVFQKYLGPLPEDMTHFCCAQFLVSRERVLARPWAMYEALLQHSLQAWHSSSAPGACYDDTCGKTSHLLEVMWPHIFNEPMPFDATKRMPQYTVPVEKDLPSAVAQLYRRVWSTLDAGQGEDLSPQSR